MLIPQNFPSGIAHLCPTHFAPRGIAVISQTGSQGLLPSLPHTVPQGTSSLKTASQGLLPSLPFPLTAPQGITPFSLLLRDSPFHPRDMLSSSSGMPPHPQNCPSRIAPLAAPPRCSSGKCSLILKAVPQVLPLIIFRDYSFTDHPFTSPQGSLLIPKTIPQGLTLSSSRVAQLSPRLPLRDSPHPFQGPTPCCP